MERSFKHLKGVELGIFAQENVTQFLDDSGTGVTKREVAVDIPGQRSFQPFCTLLYP